MATQLAPIASLVPSIIEVLMNQIALWISVRANDFSVEAAIISNTASFSILGLVFPNIMDGIFVSFTFFLGVYSAAVSPPGSPWLCLCKMLSKL